MTNDIVLNENGVLICPFDRAIDESAVNEALRLHQSQINDFKENMNFYKGEHKILNQTPKAEYKPDHRVVVNFAKYIVDTYTSYFIGIPIKITHDNESLNEFIKMFRELNDLDDNEYELAKLSAIYGRAYEYLSQDEDANTVVTYTTPISTFVVYDNTIYQRPLFAVDYSSDTSGNIKGKMFTLAEEYDISGTTNSIRFEDIDINVYQGLPIIEYVENEERQSVFENVKTLINSINKTLSEKMNDVDALADAYMKILGAKIDQEGLDFIRDNRILNFEGSEGGNVVAEFMGKPTGDTTQENLLDRLTNMVFQIAMVANINDESFGNASGVSLEFKLQPMKNLAQAKERKVKSAIKQRFKLVFGLPTNVNNSKSDEWRNLKYQFTRNIPRNVSDEADTAKKLDGVVPKDIQLSVLSIVDNPKDVAKQMEDEAEKQFGGISDLEKQIRQQAYLNSEL